MNLNNKEEIKSTDFYKKTIESAIKKYGYEVLVEDKSLDILSSMVLRKIASKDDLSNKIYRVQKSEKESTLKATLGFAATILIIISVLLSLYNTYGDQVDLKGKFSSPENKSVYSGGFEFKCADYVAIETYIGREDKLRDFLNDIKIYLHNIKTFDKPKLDAMNQYNKTSFLLHGPPGTGKTMFVHYLIGEINKYLKELHMKENDPKKYKKFKEIKDKDKRAAFLKKESSRVYLCEVSSGVINSKYHGESETRVNNLFSLANKLADNKNTAVFLFFDEGDVFFGKRSDDDSSGSQSPANVKSELLQKFGVRPSDKYLPVFVLCATNRVHVFDQGFSRRFSSQVDFKLPDNNERRIFIKNFLKDLEINDDEIEYIVNLTQNRSQAFLTKYISNYFVRSVETGEITSLELRKLLMFLNNNLGNASLS